MPNGRDRRPPRRDSVTATPPIQVSDAELDDVLIKGDANVLNHVTKKLGRYYSEGKERERLSSSQIRSILDRLQRMHKFDLNSLQLLRPQIAYAAGRHGGKVKHLQGVLDRSIIKVTGENEFENLKNFFEAIVAYHRYHGGK